MIAAAKAEANWIIRSEHLNYQHSTTNLPLDITQSLLRDFI